MKKIYLKLKKDERGIGVVEIILILVVLIALVIIFRDQIYGLVSDAFDKISDNGKNVIDTSTTITPGP